MLFPSHELLLAATPSSQTWWPVAANTGDFRLLGEKGSSQTATAQSAFMSYCANLNSASVIQNNWRGFLQEELPRWLDLSYDKPTLYVALIQTELKGHERQTTTQFL